MSLGLVFSKECDFRLLGLIGPFALRVAGLYSVLMRLFFLT